MDTAVVDAFDNAQRRAIAALGATLRGLVVGMSEAEIVELARERCKDQGFTGWFHEPHVRLGERSLKTRPWEGASGSARLQEGQAVVIDLAPSDADAYGDTGTTFWFGPGPEPELLGIAREGARGCVGFASQWKTVGEIFVFARAWAVNHRLQLHSEGAVGHALPTRTGWTATAWPKAARAATLMRRNQVHFLNPVRLSGLWAFRPVIGDAHMGAAFEEAVYINGPEKRILGRSSLAEVGTFP